MIVNAAFIVGTIVVIVGAPIVLLRSLGSPRGQRFLGWCMHWDDDETG